MRTGLALDNSDDDGSWGDSAAVGFCSASGNGLDVDCRQIDTATDSPHMHTVPMYSGEGRRHGEMVQDEIELTSNADEGLERDGSVQDGIEPSGSGGGARFSALDFGTREFESWEAFYSHVNAYQSRTYQV
ncbi:unnamed protein product [Phytophthora fragariaefolia]|uniref:Unnamed protein product n=1 Tax=Phytophthora fragariaefolia TaxID=1490495 RepID=A0A9W7D3Z8_9STRA|nr:unnamed protein product [Phytophthora fragariaefolia]